MGLGYRLKWLREEKGLSQIEVASQLKNVSNNDLSRYEKEERSPHYKTLIQFADYYDVPLDFLVGRSDIRQPDPTSNLPDEARKIVLEFIEFLKSKYIK